MIGGQAERFDAVWRDGRYDGFSRGTDGQTTTPLLETLLDNLDSPSGTLPHVVEGGAGSGDHSITIAQRGYRVTAVEYSPSAVEEIRANAQVLPPSCRDKIAVIQGDLLGYLRNGPDNMSAFYANSVLHFFSSSERAEVYERVGGLQSAGGLIAVSFKAEGDALQGRGDAIDVTEAGVLVRSAEDGITRLFVRNTTPLARELEKAGYVITGDGVYKWDVQSYNYWGEAGKFIGFLAVRK
ncbi:class I SAM-dependent methyltransferase [Candidatus Woesearchaeota archaeon]|nr:class I SAM-dependent methyltransferase [Candidatus Woesearchaeota archaeon]MBI2130187.1 class I SAM-dependent methyltransferase [Candidatus Woesearchaeota archaeon]MBI2661364.1 class I SAM-dependent methyltransferase [Candidatus Woesearchaeota archaeon]